VNVVRAILQLMRPRQWTKNLVVFAGLMFSANILDVVLFLRAFQAFLIFCLAAGAVYIFNDIQDRARDRVHPQKKNRPLASGAVSVETASLIGLVLMVVAFGWAFLLSQAFGLCLLGYVLLNLAYTLGLKRLVILDVFIISAGFVIRAAAGALIIDVGISPWLLVVTTLLSLFLGFAKRRHELVCLGEQAAAHRASLEAYSQPLLDQYLNVVASATIISYSLYTFTSSTAQQYHTLMLTIPFVIYGVLRYFYLVTQCNLGGSPEMILLKDKPMIVTIVLWALTVAVILHRT